MPSTPYTPPRELLSALAALGLPDARLQPLAGDVSPRRYLRAQAAGVTVILALYPPELTAIARRFLATTQLLEAAGVRVPAVLAVDPSLGWMLLEDLGPHTLFELQDPRRQRAGIRTAAQLAGHLGRLDRAAVAELNPALDAALLRRELAQTEQLMLAPLGLDAAPRAEISAALDVLCARLGRLPYAPSHRDLMARNLIFDRQGRLAILDHQDLRLAPATYDLASLLNDSVFASVRLERQLLRTALTIDCDPVDYHRAAVQRTLKAIGTFVAFARRGAPRHLGLIGPTFACALRHLSQLADERPLLALLCPLRARLEGDLGVLLH